ncbi:MAG: NAD(+)/NADH kinase [Candidatus Woesearchaeota archaeon]
MNVQSALLIFKGDLPKSSINFACKALKNCGILTRCIERDLLTPKAFSEADIAIVLGGDGTFLSAARKNIKMPMLCINPNNDKSEGFYARANLNEISKTAALLAEGKFKILKLLRASAKIGRRELPPALNEVFVGSEKSYRPFRYYLRIGRNKEFQLSSGVIVSTPSGSHAWASSAGGLELPITSTRLQYIVREPYFGRLFKPKMLRGFSNKVIIIPQLNLYKSVVVLDGMAEFAIKNEMQLEISKSKFPLKFVTF